MRALGTVVLAAGASERFGTENKLLADISGDSLIRNVVREVIVAAWPRWWSSLDGMRRGSQPP
jgi:CTP:molybdopterin cytidylyltransferase MocA